MERRSVSNPLVRFREVAVEYDEGDGPPPAKVTLLEDQSRSILSKNDSPDVGFTYSANPYRGCLHACAYCLSGDTKILLADGRTWRLDKLRPGDEIIGTRTDTGRRRLVRTRVVDHWETRKVAYRIVLANGTELIASGDHRFLAEPGWAYVQPAEDGRTAINLRAASGGAARSGSPDLAIAPRTTLVGPERFADPREGQMVFPSAELSVRSIERLGERTLYDITTGTGDFIANGVVSHNCYARPTHEYLDMGAGTDFDTKIVVKRNAPELLREAFDKKSWQGELVMFSGVTDCYQAIERDLKITRGMLEVCLEYKNPVSVISKSALVERDIDLFLALAKQARFHIHVSLAFADDELARKIEPWAASPSRRFKVIERLAKAGVPVGVMVAPVIPGVNDSQMVTVLERAAEAGATTAGWVLLRLPHAVKDVFEERIRVAMPLAADKVLNLIRSTRGGEKLYDSRFGTRGRGEGPYADTIAAMFDATILRLGLDRRGELDDDEGAGPTTFCRPAPKTGQLSLF